MRSTVATGSPKDTRDFLVSLAPASETELEDEATEDLTNHRVLMLFAQYFGANHGSFSTKQFRALADWLNAAVAGGGELENAVSTCFLEHASQLKVNRVLAPYLSPQAKRSTHA